MTGGLATAFDMNSVASPVWPVIHTVPVTLLERLQASPGAGSLTGAEKRIARFLR